MYASTGKGHGHGHSHSHSHSLWREIIESTRNIYISHPRHFQAISILFLFPITFSLIVFPSFCYLFPQLRLLVVLILYALFLVLFFICGVGTTIYSAVQVFYDRPIDVASSIKSIRNSFFPLLYTLIVSKTIFMSISLISTLVLVLVVRILKFHSNQFLFLVISSLIVLVPILIWLQVNWCLSYVITVVESKKGYETLRRSANLVKGKKRWVAFAILMYYVPAIVVMVVWSGVYLAKDEQRRSFMGVLLAALGSVMGYVLMNQYIVANVVLYMHCKEVNDEKSSSETVAGEYVSLPFEEEEKNHIVV